MDAEPLNRSTRTQEHAGAARRRVSRPERLLAHIAVHGLTMKVIASKLLCDNSRSKTNNLFDPLLKAERLKAFSLRGGHKYYMLGDEDADRFRIPRVRGRLSGQRVQTAIAVLSFCYLANAKRLRAPARDLKDFVGFVPRQRDAVFVVEESPEQYVGRVIVPGPGTKTDYALKILADEPRTYLRNPDTASSVSAGVFRFVILVESAARREQFAESVNQAKARQRIDARVRVDVVEVIDPTVLKASS
jgi:hypothetical protein